MLRCKNCAETLVYDIAQRKLKCKGCDTTYRVNEVEVPLSVQWKDKPKYILPFSISKEDAVGNIRKKLNKSIFVPWKYKHFEIKQISGVYVPFWIYDIFFRDSMLIHVKVKTAKSGYSYDSRVKGRVDFKGITADGVKDFNNNMSQMLDPFDLSKLEIFHEGYLAGFYADNYDVNSKETEPEAIESCEQLFVQEVKKNVSRPMASDLSVKESKPHVKVRSVSYALLPVWFVSIDYKKRSYTWLVNGQTGKVVGTAPFAKWRVMAFFTVLYILFMQFLPEWCSKNFAENYGTIYVWLVVMVVLLFLVIGLSMYFKSRLEDTTAEELKEYATRDREVW